MLVELNYKKGGEEKKVNDRVERRRASLPYHMLPQDSQSQLPWEQMGSGVEAMDQIVTQQVRRESQKNKGWQQQGRTTTTVPFLNQSSVDKKA